MVEASMPQKCFAGRKLEKKERKRGGMEGHKRGSGLCWLGKKDTDEQKTLSIELKKIS